MFVIKAVGEDVPCVEVDAIWSGDEKWRDLVGGEAELFGVVEVSPADEEEAVLVDCVVFEPGDAED